MEASGRTALPAAGLPRRRSAGSETGRAPTTLAWCTRSPAWETRVVERYDLLVVGGGLSSAKAVEAYREHGGDGSILLVSADRYPPYHRPPLSKKLLRGEQEAEQAYVQPADWYADHRVELRLETRADSLDLGGKTVRIGSGEVGFERLLIATGAEPRPFDGALTLRSIDDSLRIREQAKQ